MPAPIDFCSANSFRFVFALTSLLAIVSVVDSADPDELVLFSEAGNPFENNPITPGYVLTISRKRLTNSPAWNPDSPNPPISSRKANEAAAKHSQDVKGLRFGPWISHLLYLQPLDRWIWALESSRPNDDDGRPVTKVPIVILMDGSIILPRIANRDDQYGFYSLPIPPAIRPDSSLELLSSGLNDAYSTLLSKNRIDRSPRWEEASSDPPVAARHAIEKAKDITDHHPGLVGYRWFVETVSLHYHAGVGKHYWVVRFFGSLPGSVGPPCHIAIVVLMDGKAIEPVELKK
jgi:hypothetical protein